MPSGRCRDGPTANKTNWDNIVVTVNLEDIAESSTGGGSLALSRPYGTFGAALRGDGNALWQGEPDIARHVIDTHFEPSVIELLGIL